MEEREKVYFRSYSCTYLEQADHFDVSSSRWADCHEVASKQCVEQMTDEVIVPNIHRVGNDIPRSGTKADYLLAFT